MEIAAWLRGLGLERYLQAFQDNEVDARSLPHLTAEDLKEIGVTPIGHRRLLLQAMRISKNLGQRRAKQSPNGSARAEASTMRPTGHPEPSAGR